MFNAVELTAAEKGVLGVVQTAVAKPLYPQGRLKTGMSEQQCDNLLSALQRTYRHTASSQHAQQSSTVVHIR